MEQTTVQSRRDKGLVIAQTSRIVQNEKGQWKVPSQSGHGHYVVISNGFEAKCSCPDYEVRKTKCKHVWAVELIVTKEIDNEGNVTVTKTIRKTYPQNWPAYDKATTQQKTLFMKLLADLTKQINAPSYEFGRPTLPISDMIYSGAMKVYTTFSLRRFMSDMEEAKNKGYIDNKPCYASVGHFIQRKDITPLLVQIVTATSLPLQNVEHDFSIDSTGFGTGRFQRWYSFKHGREIRTRTWVKCHFINGVKTNVISSVKITSEFEADSPQLTELVTKTSEHFSMDEFSGDKAYSSRYNLALLDELGAKPYVPFKINTTPRPKGYWIWRKMWHYFQLNREDFLKYYHKRSNAETTVHMIKSKFGDHVRSKTWTAQVNEVLLKVICHNICCVIQEMHELGIIPKFETQVLNLGGNG